ncbi:MAG TPA: hypothetical protein VER11_08825 [Polyangiaceae bacterium]|nr:hypothetical protein [Polyangiaceae bacterium]
MAGVWQLFQECGWPSWFSLLLGLGAFALSLTALVVALSRGRARTSLFWFALVVALLPIGVGAAGMQIGRARVDHVLSLPFTDASQRERIRELGYREAASCVAVGGAFSMPPLLIALSALAGAYALRRKHVGPQRQ